MKSKLMQNNLNSTKKKFPTPKIKLPKLCLFMKIYAFPINNKFKIIKLNGPKCRFQLITYFTFLHKTKNFEDLSFAINKNVKVTH